GEAARAVGGGISRTNTGGRTLGFRFSRPAQCDPVRRAIDAIVAALAQAGKSTLRFRRGVSNGGAGRSTNAACAVEPCVQPATRAHRGTRDQASPANNVHLQNLRRGGRKHVLWVGSTGPMVAPAPPPLHSVWGGADRPT